MVRKVILSRINILWLSLFAIENGMAMDEEDIQVKYLDTITVSATRIDKPLYEVPLSIAYVALEEIQFGRQQLGIDESLVKVPGLFMQNRYNFAQDLRISIRGFGSRATFGIRGIKLYIDGIPVTLPDGQGGVDSIDIGSLGHMEVIRGPVSSLYGSASGGVINMFTEDGPVDKPYIEARSSIGSHKFRKHQVKMGGQEEKLNYLVNISRLEYDGYRENSNTENILLNSKFRYDIDDISDFTLTFNALHSPEAQDPGGLMRTGNAFNVDISTPGAAQRNNIRFDAGESVDQIQLGLLYNKNIGENHDISLRNYYVFRDFYATLPFGDFTGMGITPSGGIVDLERIFVGVGGQYSYSSNIAEHENRLTVGIDIDSQMDDRVNFTNIVNSTVIGPLSLDQDEDVLNWGIFLQDEFSISNDLELTLGVRYDEVEFDFHDNYLNDGIDNTGKITFSEWSPRAGLMWQFSEALNIYTNVSTSFEPPSSREFANPTSAGGFNPALRAQSAINYELGIKGELSPKTNYELVIFRIKTEDELILAGQNPAGSGFFTNAGETVRNGVEAVLNLQATKELSLSLTYTYSDFKFSHFIDKLNTSFSGNHIPGIPTHNTFAELSYSNPSGFYFTWDTQFVDKVFVDNANSDAAESYSVSNLRLGYSISPGKTDTNLFLGINNIFDKSYIGAVRVNEANSRFFEPAPERNIYAGISIRYF